MVQKKCLSYYCQRNTGVSELLDGIEAAELAL
jgi:hypothetical protein